MFSFSRLIDAYWSFQLLKFLVKRGCFEIYYYCVEVIDMKMHELLMVCFLSYIFSYHFQWTASMLILRGRYESILHSQC